jgi:c-di-GMP-binding flagellar brake protein YcgR
MLARLHLRANRARRLYARGAVETSVLAPGQRCRIEGGGPNGAAAVGVVSGVARRSVTLRIDCPQTAPPRGAPIVVTVVGPSAAYRFLSSVADAQSADGAVVLHLNRPPWVEKIQRRAYFRAPIEAPTSVTARTPNDPDGVTLACTITDLSAGGIRLVSPKPLEIGTALVLRAPTAEDALTRFEARVRTCEPICAAGDRWALGCEFERTDEDTRQRVLAYCFDLERLARRRPARNQGAPAGPDRAPSS